MSVWEDVILQSLADSHCQHILHKGKNLELNSFDSGEILMEGAGKRKRKPVGWENPTCQVW